MIERLLDNLAEAWATFTLWQRVGIVAFEIAWLVQLVILAGLIFG